jgi:hypothetical protein
MTTVNLEGLTRAAFLDEHGRFAKSNDAVAIVRLFYGDDCRDSVDISVDDFMSLTEDERTSIEQAGSGAGCIDTSGKSNA